MISGSDREQLPCGQAVEDLLNQIADGRSTERSAHQRQCLHCQAALGEYERLWAPMQELAAQQVRVPESAVENALRIIRGAVQGTDYGVLESAQGWTRISARVVVVAARETAQAVPGVRVALSKRLADRSDLVAGPGGPVDQGDGTEVAAGMAGRSTAIEITLAASYGVDLIGLGEQVRTAVSARVRELTDLEPVQITVVIDDVFE